MRPLLLVAAGGAFGSALRWLVATAVQQSLPRAVMPWGTCTVNVLGSFAIGVLMTLAVERAHCSGTPAIDRPFMPARTDFYMISAGLGPVALCLRAAARLSAVNRRNLTIALGYNAAMIAIAMMGAMSPLLCAIVMPLTSLSILLATIASLSPRSTQWKS